MLTLASTFAVVDRQLLSLLVQPIQADLHLTDTDIGLMQGFGHALFYTAAALPMARLADRSNRRTIIAGAIFLLAFTTMISGTSRSVYVLILARLGMGVGEASMAPSIQSLLSDYFDRERLPIALAAVSMSIYLGGGLSLIVGGQLLVMLDLLPPPQLPILGAVHAWQAVFLLVAAPGLLLGLAALSIREPARAGALRLSAAPLRAIASHLAASAGTYIGIIGGFCLMVLVGQGSAAWIPSLFVRRFGWSPADVGLYYGGIVVCCGAAGTLSGGMVASLLRRRGHRRANLLAAAIGFAALVPLTIAFPLMPTPTVTLAVIGVMNFFAGFPFGGGFAALQDVTPNRLRAQVTALCLLSISLIGGGLGPAAVALVTDHAFGDPSALPWALALVAAVISPLALIGIAIAMAKYPAAVARLADPGSARAQHPIRAI